MVFNSIRFSNEIKTAVAKHAALVALGAFERAKREVEMPRPVRRPLAEIHAEVRAARAIARSLARES